MGTLAKPEMAIGSFCDYELMRGIGGEKDFKAIAWTVVRMRGDKR